MPDTSTRLGIPFLQAAQAQKHVTVNEALTTLDALTNMVLQSISTATPPAMPEESQCYFVPDSPTGDWANEAGKIAHVFNGGWRFVTPLTGMRAWLADEDKAVVWNGSAWQPITTISAANGATTKTDVVTASHTVTAGATNDTGLIIPERSILFAVSGTVSTAFSGTLASFAVGLPGQETRFSNGLWIGQGSTFVGPSTPEVIWSDTPVRLSAEGGDFTGGEINLAAHVMRFTAPF
ncbi:DUF2793 domain-containing protein [Epibacterium sp. SM1979]|uniref:DUF2793 domain-containing protein n=1 Tax=Tritonibacter litoralis TaxID=2662264 RepID=A0A843YI31_9RHOB|nr:DUF2793 domain-containing protein [Tritonibacter litoralis]MQQ09094.1 DUF2793 domain-containing protein [Tritonibacter litoralis]